LYNSPADTLFIGSSIIYLPECHSTNTAVLHLFENEPLSEGTVVITDKQTAGRGQRGNDWEAAPGHNLTFSLVLTPRFLSVRDQFLLTISISLAIYDFLTDLQVPDVCIKWPNDLYSGSQKIGGILIESSLKNAQLEWSVIGIGLNILQKSFSVPTATSLALLLQDPPSLQEALQRVLKALEVRYLQLRAGAHAQLRRDYLEQLYGLGQWRLFESEGETFSGKIVGIDQQGQLAVLHRQRDQLQYFNMQQIRFLP
jgi:BirA family transcriptional regulator, biotin operon repressor / biotin---[acetyl-CoA-carboxylase] ligase